MQVINDERFNIMSVGLYYKVRRDYDEEFKRVLIMRF